jgi:hypothetical protein
MLTLPRWFKFALTLPLLLSALLNASNVQADWQANLPEAKVIGQGKLTWLGMHIYSARLWAAQPDQPEQLFKQPFALELTYQRDISRERLVKSSVDEIRRVKGRSVSDENLQRWAGEMRQAFVDVSPGQQIVGVHMPGTGARFYVNGEPSHTVADAEFSQAFFSIWLDSKTRSPALRQALLGAQ